jgi:predicted nucleotidyltransferase
MQTDDKPELMIVYIKSGIIGLKNNHRKAESIKYEIARLAAMLGIPAIMETTTMGNVADIDTETLSAAHAFMEAVAIRYDMMGAILFGSRARKSHRQDSDADVAVLLHGQPGKFVPTKLEMDDLAYDVLLNTGIRIQPLPIWEEEWSHPEAYSNPRLGQYRA